jgi:hypothetical protein
LLKVALNTINQIKSNLIWCENLALEFCVFIEMKLSEIMFKLLFWLRNGNGTETILKKKVFYVFFYCNFPFLQTIQYILMQL